jgi:glycosyltransferase involved in cell wall biosynthesis
LEDVNALANAINSLIENESLRKEMGLRAYESSQRFAPERIYAKWTDLFRELDID